MKISSFIFSIIASIILCISNSMGDSTEEFLPRLDIPTPYWVQYSSISTNTSNFGLPAQFNTVVNEKVCWAINDAGFFTTAPATLLDTLFSGNGDMQYALHFNFIAKSIAYERITSSPGYNQTVRHFKGYTSGTGTQGGKFTQIREEIQGSISDIIRNGPSASYWVIPSVVGKGVYYDFLSNGTVSQICVELKSATMRITPISQKVSGSVLRLYIFAEAADIPFSNSKILISSTEVPWNGGIFQIFFPTTIPYKNLTYNFYECYTVPENRNSPQT